MNVLTTLCVSQACCCVSTEPALGTTRRGDTTCTASSPLSTSPPGTSPPSSPSSSSSTTCSSYRSTRRTPTTDCTTRGRRGEQDEKEGGEVMMWRLSGSNIVAGWSRRWRWAWVSWIQGKGKSVFLCYMKMLIVGFYLLFPRRKFILQSLFFEPRPDCQCFCVSGSRLSLSSPCSC